jgi:hypothetical protein
MPVPLMTMESFDTNNIHTFEGSEKKVRHLILQPFGIL